MKRRTFLKTSALAPVFFAAARAGEPPQKKIRCAILGIDHSHAPDVLGVLQKSPDFELAGVCEPDEATRARFASTPEFKDVHWLSQGDLLRDDTIKMVAIESYVPRLLPLARTAIEANKHVHIDKPAGASLAELSAVLDEAAKRERIVQMGYMFRYNPGFDFVRRAVNEKWLGDVYAIHASMCTDFTPDKRVRAAKYSGGMMFELGSHLVDMIVLLLGSPAKVTPFIRHDASLSDPLADNTLAVFEYPKCIVSVEVAAMEPDAFPTRRFKVCGPDGSIVLCPLEPPSARLSLRKDVAVYKKGSQTIHFDDLPRHALDFADLAACIRGERKIAYTREHDLNVLKTLLLASGMPA